MPEETFPPPRLATQRKIDAIFKLQHDKDLWIATSDLKGTPCLVPLSFWWDNTFIYVATVKKNPTAQNILKTNKARVILGNTRDVLLIDTTAEMLEPKDISTNLGGAYKNKCGWDPREVNGYHFFRLNPIRVESWKEENEHKDRELMRDGSWLV